jgi:hypothetical protein
MQNIKDWPIFVKIGFGFLISTLVIAGLVEIPKLSGQKTPLENAVSDLVDIDVLVYTESKEPLEGVEVRFIVKGSPVVKQTNTEGYTQIQIPKVGDIDIELRKKGFKTATHNIDTQIDPKKNREYILMQKQLQK